MTTIQIGNFMIGFPDWFGGIVLLVGVFFLLDVCSPVCTKKTHNIRKD